MTKKLFLTLVSAVFLVLMLAGCGDKKENDTTDTGNTGTVSDEDATDTGDTAADADNTDTGDTATDTDEDNTDTGTVTQEGCTIKSSFGTHSAKRELTETCIKELAQAEAAHCSWDRRNENETAQHLALLLRLEITFGKECKDKNNEEQTVDCPDFIPESLSFTKLTGCDVYSIDPNSLCLAPCADFYFSTNDTVFHTVYLGDEYGEYPFIKSSDSIKEASLLAYYTLSDHALFSWSETAEDGSDIENGVWVKMTIVDPNAAEEEPAPDTDIVPDEDEEIEVMDE